METKKVWMEEVALDKVDFIDNVRLEEDVSSLMQTIKAQGLLEPVGMLINKEKKGRYLLVFGYKRFKAVGNLGWATIPAMVSDIEFKNEKEMERYLIITNLTENTYEKPSPIEQGRKYSELQKSFNMSISEIAALTGEPKGAIQDDIFTYKTVPEAFRGDVVRARVGTDTNGKLPISIVKDLGKKLKNHKLSKEENNKIWGYVKQNALPAADLSVIMEIMLRLNVPFDKALALSQECKSVTMKYIFNRKIMQDLETQYSMSITKIVEGIIRGEIPSVKNLVMKREKKVVEKKG